MEITQVPSNKRKKKLWIWCAIFYFEAKDKCGGFIGTSDKFDWWIYCYGFMYIYIFEYLIYIHFELRWTTSHPLGGIIESQGQVLSGELYKCTKLNGDLPQADNDMLPYHIYSEELYSHKLLI